MDDACGAFLQRSFIKLFRGLAEAGQGRLSLEVTEAEVPGSLGQGAPCSERPPQLWRCEAPSPTTGSQTEPNKNPNHAW